MIRTGGTIRINTTVFPETATSEQLAWDSNDPSIAIVDENGVVTGVRVGETDINARATDGSGTIQAIHIYVDATPVESVSITANGPTTLKDGETLQLTATVMPEDATDKSIRWVSKSCMTSGDSLFLWIA